MPDWNKTKMNEIRNSNVCIRYKMLRKADEKIDRQCQKMEGSKNRGATGSGIYQRQKAV